MGIEGWHRHTPSLVSRIGRPDFAPALDTALSELAGFDLTCAFAYPGEDRPLLLHDGLGGVSSPAIMDNYLNGTYLLDAVYAACRRQVPEGLYRLRELAPDDFFEGDYFKSPHVHPCISMESGTLAEEIVFIVALSPATHVAYSLMRQNGRAPFREDDMAALRAVAPMVTALLGQHWRGRVPTGAEDGALLEQAFATFRAGTLTPREQTIVSLVLRGHSTLSIARLLAIAEGTVKIHRKHIHSKLGISSQTELFNLFISHLIGEGT